MKYQECYKIAMYCNGILFLVVVWCINPQHKRIPLTLMPQFETLTAIKIILIITLLRVGLK